MNRTRISLLATALVLSCAAELAAVVQVTVQSPTAGATVGSPTQFTATATSANPITGFVVYANNQDVLQVNASSLNGTANLSAGTYSIYIRAWDSTGAFGTSATFSITVSTVTTGCPAPPGVRVRVQAPSPGAAAPLVQFAATATSANPITGFVVYANNQNIYQTNSSSLNANVALPDGIYSIYVRAWDSTGAFGTSSPFSITVSKNVQVTVGFPAAGALLGTPAHFAATATSANPITGFVVYANNQNVLQVNASSLNGTANLSAGNYNIYIRAWDSTGGFATSPTFSITVGPTLPTPPPTAIAVDGIDDSTISAPLGWGSCVDACCAGGAADADASSSPAYQFQTTPSLDGASTEFMISGPAFADALHWYKLGPQNWATNYLWDFWTYLDDDSLTAQAIEFDAFTVVPIAGVNRKFMFGSQCNYASGVWDGWTEGGGTWVPTTIACTKFSTKNWHHGTWYFKRVGTNLDQLQYVSLTLDGVTNDANMLQLSQPTNWDQVLGVQYQQDLGPNGTPFHQWIDKVKLTIW